MNWIESYMDYTAGTGSPAIHRLWAAIAIVAGALERKRWVVTSKGRLFPNLYTLLVGEPGVGKSVQTDIVYRFWSDLSKSDSCGHKVAVPSVTSATVIDELFDAKRRIVRPQEDPSVVEFNSLLIAVNELSVLLPSWDTAMLGKLTDLYDCKVYGERRRGKGINFTIPNPQLNIISATTPAQLASFLPDGAWDQGFMSRMILIYSGEVVEFDLWTSEFRQEGRAYDALFKDLERIGSAFGPLHFSNDAAKAINEWQKAGGPPRPSHPRLIHYTTRRTAHLLKLCLAVAASCGGKQVELDHYNQALHYLLEAEKAMPDVFKAMTSGGDMEVIREAWHFAYEQFMSSAQQDPVPEGDILQFICSRTSAHNAPRVLSVMIQSGILQEELVNKVGRCYRPKPMKRF